MQDSEIKAHIKMLEQGNFGEKMLACKALKSVAEPHPEIIAPFYKNLIGIVKDKNAKVAWATMILLASIGELNPKLAFENLSLFAELADGDSVIVHDVYVKILTALATHKKYQEDCITLLIDEVLKAPINQLPSYAKSATSVIDKANAPVLYDVIVSRLPDAEDYPPKTKKLQMLLKQLGKM